MQTDNKREIIDLLILAGREGISVKTLARYVAYHCNTFFDPVDYEDVEKEVRAFIRRGIHRKQPYIEHAKKRGHYRICKKTREGRQLLLQYGEQEEKAEKAVEEKLLPGLFD